MLVERRKPSKPHSDYLPYRPDKDGVAPMANCGDGYRIHITGLTHNERGYPGMDEDTQKNMVTRLIRKIVDNKDKIIQTNTMYLDDAEIVVVAYGISARSARYAVHEARSRGIRSGLIKLDTVWPFPEALIRDVATRAQVLIMPEINAGQMVLEMERCAGGACPVHLVSHLGGSVIHPAAILDAVKNYEKKKKGSTKKNHC